MAGAEAVAAAVAEAAVAEQLRSSKSRSQRKRMRMRKMMRVKKRPTRSMIQSWILMQGQVADPAAGVVVARRVAMMSSLRLRRLRRMPSRPYKMSK